MSSGNGWRSMSVPVLFFIFGLLLLSWRPATAAPSYGNTLISHNHHEEDKPLDRQVQPSVTRKMRIETSGNAGIKQVINNQWNAYVYDAIGREDEPQERTLVDLMPHIGSFIFRGFVRRVLIKPVIGGFKRLIPSDFYSYYQQKLLKRRFFQLMSPLSPLVSSYAYNKFEQGIFWGLKKGYSFVSDNFIEWERPGEDGELVDSQEEDERRRKRRKRRRTRNLSI